MSTSDDARAREEKAATAFNKKLADDFVASRMKSAIFAIVMFLLAIGVGFTGQWMIVFCLVCLGLIGALNGMDAHGELQEVRRWSNKRLYTRLSAIDRRDPGSAAKTPAP